uniref:IclR family transcriptional regulator domain-containing protein n=1 Tax=Nocardia grenadensis TaxID=931537 RepID=UPI0007A3CD1F|nr:IclR family transcriptional regulator C-terminal domain-containing protein [Nocardia grenadensis]
MGSREGMVFPAHRVTAGLILLAAMDPSEVGELYSEQRFEECPGERPDMRALRAQFGRVRRAGFALNDGLSERGVVAVGGVPTAGLLRGLSISMPSVPLRPSAVARTGRHTPPSAGAIDIEN